MKIPWFLFFLLWAVACTSPDSSSWEPAPSPLLSTWGESLSPDSVWHAYPRPQLRRERWQNLNGLWQYAIQEKEEGLPEAWDGEILVPFPIESALSGVKKRVAKQDRIWYRRTFPVPEAWRAGAQRLMLNFEAVDWECQVWINDQKVGSHQGGYDPFSFDISSFLKEGSEQELILSVWDPTDEGPQPRGKQVSEPGGIYYTPVSGIWQTVWLEPLEPVSISKVDIWPNIRDEAVRLQVEVAGGAEGDEWVIEVGGPGKQVIHRKLGASGVPVTIPIPQPELWSPEHPYLYTLKVEVLRNGEAYDQVFSYFGMREINLKKDEEGITRMFLNGEFVFQNGLLDQGFWPGGIYTAPSDDALRYDIEMAKAMGFNLLRKHVKVEPRRWYYWADRLGILVWQDMPSGEKSIGPDEPDLIRDAASAQIFERELEAMINHLNNHPSIIVWVPFNEGWGQYETQRITDRVRQLDSSRLVNPTSGWSDRGGGDILDLHHYPAPIAVMPEDRRAAALGEFGGLGLPVDGHLWEANNWGYQGVENPQMLLQQYEQFYVKVWGFKNEPGLSAAIYTQLTDVETETNGLMSYDRKVIKIDTSIAQKINRNDFVASPLIEAPDKVFYQSMKLAFSQPQGYEVRYTIDGSDPGRQSYVYQRPLTLTTDMHLRARAFTEEGDSSLISEGYYFWRNDPPPQYKHAYSPRYTAGGSYGLLDGLKGSTRFGDGRWQGFHQNDLEVVLDLGAEKSLHRLSTAFLEDSRSWIFLPTEVEWEISKDGEHFESLKSFSYPAPSADRDPLIETASVSFSPQQVRFVRLRARNLGTCPEWHIGKSGKAWLFIDEIVVE